MVEGELKSSLQPQKPTNFVLQNRIYSIVRFKSPAGNVWRDDNVGMIYEIVETLLLAC